MFQAVFPIGAIRPVFVDEHGPVAATSHADGQQLAFHTVGILERLPGKPADFVHPLFLAAMSVIHNIADAGWLVPDFRPALEYVTIGVDDKGVHPVGPAGVGDTGIIRFPA